MNTRYRLGFLLCLVSAMVLGYLVARLHQPATVSFEDSDDDIPLEQAIIQLQKLEGDIISAEISGEARIVWADDQSVEGAGIHQIPVSQIFTTNDLDLRKFPFTGNMKTKKFYPSDNYSARGTEVRYRRFFQTKDAAIAAGFIPSKAVK